VTAIIPAPSQNIIINTMEQWDIISLLPTWLQLSAISGSGNATVEVTPVNYTDLAAGNYNATFDVVIGSLIFTVTVNLTVTNFFENPFSAGKLYFLKNSII
jgi:hypothetical protein